MNIENNIEALEKNLTCCAPHNKDKLLKLKLELEEIHNEIYISKVKGNQIRSRCKWVNESDTNPKFFKSLELKHQINNKITCLKDENNNIKNDTEDLLKITMTKTLQKFGFGETFWKWIDVIYNNCLSCVKVNAYLTEKFNISRGIKQGCPLSAMIFILCTQILANAIKSNQNINGISVPTLGLH